GLSRQSAARPGCRRPARRHRRAPGVIVGKSVTSLPEIPGGWAERDFALAGPTLRVTLPASPDAFLDDPDVLAANRRDDYMPYWSYLWPTALETAVAVLNHEWQPGTAALEIGAGIALTGLAALASGLRVVFSDYDRQAIDLALYNARANQLDEQ